MERKRPQVSAIKTSVITVALMMSTGAHAAIISVTNTNDNGAGSLRAALASATNGDTIKFAFSLPATIRLSNGEIFVTNSVNIIGPGPSNLTLDGNATSRVFHMSNTVVSICSLTITNGKGGILCDDSTLTVSNCVLSGNSAYAGGGIYAGGRLYDFGINGRAKLAIINTSFIGNSSDTGGGAIFNNGGYGRQVDLSIVNSTFSNNSAWVGGGIENSAESAGNAMMTVSNCTFIGNVAKGYAGGGIFHTARGGGTAVLTVLNSTFSGNSAGRVGGCSVGIDGGMGGNATLMIHNTILDESATCRTIFNDSATVTSLGHNRSSDDNGPNDSRTDVINTNPMLGPLTDNGGPTNTRALSPDSPVVNAKDSSPSRVQHVSPQVNREEFDAAILSQGTSKDGFINPETQAQIMTALKAIRAKFPEVAKIHARSTCALDRMFVGLTTNGQQIIAQKVKIDDSQQTELIAGGTGIRELDELNRKFAATSVKPLIGPDLLLVRFTTPMDIPVLSKIYAGIPAVAGAEGVMMLGGGDQIELKRENQVWRFTFTHGWGDCPSGCINHHYYYFSYRPDTQAVTKTGEEKRVTEGLLGNEDPFP